MTELESLYNDKKKYTILKKNIETLVWYLDTSINNLEKATTDMSNAYLIDGEQADNKILLGIKEELKSNSDFLKNTIRPNINSKISSLSQEIAMKEYYGN